MSKKLKAVGRIFLALILGLIVLAVSSSISIILSGRFPELVQALPMGEAFIIQICFLIMSILLILLLSRGDTARYGFIIGKNTQFTRIIIFGVLIGIASDLAGTIVSGEASTEPGYGSFIDLIIGVWILASIAEEVFTRGLIQGFLNPLADAGFSIRGIRFSVPVLVSAIFFGLMHLGILSTGADPASVIIIVIFAFILGIAAGYYREKSGSLIPAIIIHICANAGSWLGDLIGG